MYIIKLKQDTEQLCNKISTSFVMLYTNRTLEIAACIIRVPDQDEFFNILPLLKQVRDEAKNHLQLLWNERGSRIGSIVYEYSEQDVELKEPDIYLTVKDDNTPFLSNKPVNLCVVMGVEQTKANHIRPYFQIVGAETYPDWAFVYGAANKLISTHGSKLSNMELDLTESHEVTRTTDDIMEELE